MQQVYRVSEGSASPDSHVIAEAAKTLQAGGLALLPTETVYGIGVAVSAYAGSRPANAELPDPGTGYRRIFDLKRRDLAQTVPWLVGSIDDLDRYGAEVDPRARALAEAFWPGALTIVVPASDAVPAFMRAADGTVALRMSASPVVLALAQRLDSPLAVTSANLHGKPAPAAFADVDPLVLDGVDVAIDAGETPYRDASTIVSFAPSAADGSRVIRAGALSADRIARVLSPMSPSARPE